MNILEILKLDGFMHFWKKKVMLKSLLFLESFLELMKINGKDTDNIKYIKALEIVKRLSSKAHIDLDDVSHIWEKDKIRIFISHRDRCKNEARKLAQMLSTSGVTCFFAHDSIQPMSIWKK